MVWTRSVTQKQSSSMWFKWERRVMKPHVQCGLFVSHTHPSGRIVYEQAWKWYRFAGRCRKPHVAVASAQGLKQVEGFCIQSVARSHHAASGRLHYILSRKWIWWCLSVITELDLTFWTRESALPPPQGLPRRHFESSWFNQYWLSTHYMPSTVPVRDKAQGTKYIGSSGHYFGHFLESGPRWGQWSWASTRRIFQQRPWLSWAGQCRGGARFPVFLTAEPTGFADGLDNRLWEKQ